jgi:2-polyprenyl-3-methyl-5-hydroxy-6-metoxy-1,4-benzoquinol methylase
MNSNLTDYYTQRAPHYDEIYHRPERLSELNAITVQLQQFVQDKNVLEVACGTGFWTERYASRANQVLATDINDAMLDIARARACFNDAPDVEFQHADAHDLPQGDFNVCVAGFWWSHVKRSEQTEFLEGLQKKCGSGTGLILFDNCYVEGSSTPIARTDSEGNTYQIRRLPDGSRHEVIKNFPTDSTLRKKLAQHARDIRVVRGDYFWILTCVLR